jgi:dienelactone hydrolase
MRRRILLLGLLFHAFSLFAYSQTVRNPQTLIVRSGSLRLRALLWRPAGRGPFPAILFSPGSGQNPYPQELGRLFARRGYVFLGLFRSGQGLSSDQGEESSRAVNRERAANGDDAANRLQLRLLEGEQLDQQLSAFAVLRSRRDVDPNRISIVGHSFGGSLAMLMAEREPSIRAIISFGGAAASWGRSAYLRERLMSAAQKLNTPVFFIQAANDYSTLPSELLDAELERQGKQHRLKIYPSFGQTVNEGHNLIYLSMTTWQRDVFDFLNRHTSSRP